MISINTEDILNIYCEVRTTKEFDHLVLVTLATDKQLLDVLFNSSGRLVEPGEQCEAIKNISSFFNKDFRIINLNNTLCLGQILK